MTEQSQEIMNLPDDERIPLEYRSLWRPFQANGMTLFHLTTQANLESIRLAGQLIPKDPAPRNWAGMSAIFLANPSDPIYARSLPHVLAHAQKKGDRLVRLYIETENSLYRSTDPERTFQVMSLDPISTADIVKIEYLD